MAPAISLNISLCLADCLQCKPDSTSSTGPFDVLDEFVEIDFLRGCLSGISTNVCFHSTNLALNWVDLDAS